MFSASKTRANGLPESLAVGECLRCLPLRPIEAHAFEESPPVALEAGKLRALA
jgi:hypothetical protein